MIHHDRHLDILCSALRLGCDANILHGISVTNIKDPCSISQTFAMRFRLGDPARSTVTDTEAIVAKVRTVTALMAEPGYHTQHTLLLVPGLYPNMLEELHYTFYRIYDENVAAFSLDSPRWDYWQAKISAPDTVY